jgi:glutathione S-transferase
LDKSRPIEEDGLVLFESGAILLHIAERSEALMPSDPKARARVTAWMFAALNSIEPRIQNLAAIDLFHPNEEWAKTRRPEEFKFAQKRLAALSDWLEGRQYLEGRFTVADLLMTTVLRIPRNTDLITQMPVVNAYRIRCEARPTFKKAFALAPASRRDSRKSRVGSCGLASQPRRISPAAGMADISNRPAPRAKPA